MFKSGYVAIVGSPNAGKSTLLNELLDSKVAITSDKVGTTRNMIKGIYTDDNMQVVFVDTPGINVPKNKLQVYMKHQVDEALSSVNTVIYLLDASVGLRKRELEIIDRLKKDKNTHKIACLNKIDLINQDKAINLITQMQDMEIFEEVFALSLKEGLNTKSFLKTIYDTLLEGDLIYQKEQVTDFTLKFYVSEIIREKALRNTFDEIPHGIYIRVDEIEEEEKNVYIQAVVFVERESQKGIVIGKKAEMIKKIGKNARYDLERYFDKNVYLDLTVRVDKKWTNKNEEVFEMM